MSGNATFTHPSAKLASLELGRGIAALAVVAHHAAKASDAFSSKELGHWFSAGALGVDFFFVLSGFIIYHVHHKDPRTLNAAQRFLGKRLRRIYVPYLPVTLALIAAYTLFPEISQGNRDWSFFTSLTLMPSGSPPALSVAWTLVFEMMFYIFFFFVFFFTRHFWLLVSVWVTAIAAFAFAGLTDQFDIAPINVILSPLILEFVAGMTMAMLFSRLSPNVWAIPTLLGLGLAAAYFTALDVDRVFFGLALAPLVLGLALAETQFGYRLPSPAILLGAASYAIYLVHNPLQSLVARAFRGADNYFLTFTACCFAAVAVGITYHVLFERPALQFLTQRKIRRNNISTKKSTF